MNPLAGRRGGTARAPWRAAAAAIHALNHALTRALTVGAAFAPLAARAADLQAVNQAAGLGAASSAGASVAKAASGVAALGAGSAVPSLGFGAVLQTVFGLVLVIGVVFGCAWLARRLGIQGSPRNALVKTVGGASLGGKERVAVVEIGDTWLVLGTAPGNVRLLHTMPAGTAPEAAAGPASPALSGSFGQRFRDALKDEAGKRFRRHDGGAQ